MDWSWLSCKQCAVSKHCRYTVQMETKCLWDETSGHICCFSSYNKRFELFLILSMFTCAGRVLLEVCVYSVGCTAKSVCRSERCLSKPPYCLPGRQLSLINTLLQVHHLCYEFMVRFLFRPRVHRAKMSCGSGGAACIFPVGKDTERNKWLVNHRRNHMERNSMRKKAWDLTTKMVQRSGGLQLHFSCG